jgi:predicted small lipoprotein YifL
MPRSRLTLYLLLLVAALTLTGCGKKGPLYLPQQTQSGELLVGSL